MVSELIENPTQIRHNTGNPKPLWMPRNCHAFLLRSTQKRLCIPALPCVRPAIPAQDQCKRFTFESYRGSIQRFVVSWFERTSSCDEAFFCAPTFPNRGQNRGARCNGIKFVSMVVQFGGEHHSTNR